MRAALGENQFSGPGVFSGRLFSLPVIGRKARPWKARPWAEWCAGYTARSPEWIAQTADSAALTRPSCHRDPEVSPRSSATSASPPTSRVLTGFLLYPRTS